MAARTSTTKTKPVAEAAVAEESVTAVDIVADENMSVEVKEAEEAKTVTKKTAKPAVIDKDEVIEVLSLIPNVSYKDSKYGDLYEWEKAGEVLEMPFEVINVMWTKHKTYFKSMWLKPLDDRVVKKFNLSSVYDKYDFLMDASNYNRENINELCESIRHTPASLKLAVCNKVKSFVATGEVSDVKVLREIERNLNIDLIPLISD